MSDLKILYGSIGKTANQEQICFNFYIIHMVDLVADVLEAAFALRSLDILLLARNRSETHGDEGVDM
jgi:hypothetical protein